MSKATSNAHDWPCGEPDTYGWRGEACRKYPTAASEITTLREQVKKLENRLNKDSQEFTILCAKETEKVLREQVEKLAKERDELKTVPMKYRRMQFNAELQDEVTQLQKQLAALAEQNEKMRSFFEFAWKDIPMSEYAFKILEHTMNLPDLATIILNKEEGE